MKIYTEDFLEGMEEMMALYKQGSNIFDMPGGNLFPHNTSQKSWEFAKSDGNIHFSDGTHTFSFKGDLGDYDSELTMLPDVPLPTMYTGEAGKKNRQRAQVHRSDPGSIYFTLQEGHKNPTYTLKHMGDNKWKAIPKAHKAKDKLNQPMTPHNVNLDAVKEGMLKELELDKLAGVGHGFNMGLGNVIQQGANLIPNALLMAGRTGPVTYYGDPNQNATQSTTSSLGNAALAGGIGALGGGAYHLAKRHLLNTPEENMQEDMEGGHGLKRVLAPAGVMAGLNFMDRSVFPRAINNPEMQAFPA